MLSPILALDIATQSGWAFGPPDATPRNGSIRFAREGASQAAVWAGCYSWLIDFVAVNPEIKLVVFEAPMNPGHMQGKTNITTLRTLIGLAAIVEAALYGKGFDIREARVSDVRAFFLGTTRIKSAEAKAATFARCVQLGFKPVSLDASDALALWCYQTSIISPEHGVKFMPLFGRGF